MKRFTTNRRSVKTKSDKKIKIFLAEKRKQTLSYWKEG